MMWTEAAEFFMLARPYILCVVCHSAKCENRTRTHKAPPPPSTRLLSTGDIHRYLATECLLSITSVCTRTSPSDRFLQLVSLYVSHETLILIYSHPPPSSLCPCPPTTTSCIIIISRETDARRSSSSSHRVIIIGVIIISSTWASA